MPAGDIGEEASLPGSGRSPGGGDDSHLQYSHLENPKDRGAWWATVHRAAKSEKSQARPRTHRHTYSVTQHLMESRLRNVFTLFHRIPGAAQVGKLQPWERKIQGSPGCLTRQSPCCSTAWPTLLTSQYPE